MGLRYVLAQVAVTYDKEAGTHIGVPGQDVLRSIAHLDLPIPAGFIAKGRGGQSGKATNTPWIGVHDPDINENAKEGLYLAYIFAADLRSVWLTLQQGIEGLLRQYKKGKRLRDELQDRVNRLRSFPPLEHKLDGWLEPAMSLNTDTWRAAAYEAASVAARRYDTGNLPTEADLRADLWHAAELLQEAARAERLLISRGEPNPGRLVVEYQTKPEHHMDATPNEHLARFQPKDDSDYLAHIAAHTQRKQRRHERLIREFGEYAQERGLAPNTNVHPRDLTLALPDAECLVEAKVVRSTTTAVREAVGQLLEYRHFLYKDCPPPRLLALFTDDIQVYVPYLESLGIASVWKTPDGWAGSPSACAWGLIDPPR